METDLSQVSWTLEAEAVTVVAHAQHGRLDLVEELTAELPDRLAAMLLHPVPNPPPYLMELPISGGLLLALAMVDLDRGARAGVAEATRSGVRMIALAERFRFPRNFQPTMATARARQAATHADRSAYPDAVSTTALSPMAVPSSSPRRVSITGVNGWYSANQRSPVGRESV